jgi:peptidoglycan/xylan/chitin deacetylase (PgdA/CDA1 family)
MSIVSRIKSKIERTVVDNLFSFHLEKLLISNKKINTIVMYHGIDSNENTQFNSRCIGVENFKKQILFLKQNTNIISLQDFFEEKFDPSRSNIAITFDDGFLNNYKYAFPFLNEQKVPATIYVTGLNQTQDDILWPDFLDISSYFHKEDITIDSILYSKNSQGKYYSIELQKTLNEVIKLKGNYDFKLKVYTEFEKTGIKFKENENYFDYWKLMNNEQLIEVDKSPYVKIESHAFWHNNLGNIPLIEAEKELIDSKNYLENLLQREITEIAYPDGSYSRELLNIATNLGFKYQLAAARYNFNEDILDTRIKDRVGLYPSVSWANQMYALFK